MFLLSVNIISNTLDLIANGSNAYYNNTINPIPQFLGLMTLPTTPFWITRHFYKKQKKKEQDTK